MSQWMEDRCWKWQISIPFSNCLELSQIERWRGAIERSNGEQRLRATGENGGKEKGCLMRAPARRLREKERHEASNLLPHTLPLSSSERRKKRRRRRSGSWLWFRMSATAAGGAAEGREWEDETKGNWQGKNSILELRGIFYFLRCWIQTQVSVLC